MPEQIPGATTEAKTRHKTGPKLENSLIKKDKGCDHRLCSEWGFEGIVHSLPWRKG